VDTRVGDLDAVDATFDAEISRLKSEFHLGVANRVLLTRLTPLPIGELLC
jgi:hypothetical protein